MTRNLCTYMQTELYIHVCYVQMAWLYSCMLECYWLFTVCCLIGKLSMPICCAYAINIYGYSLCMDVYFTIQNSCKGTEWLHQLLLTQVDPGSPSSGGTVIRK